MRTTRGCALLLDVAQGRDPQLDVCHARQKAQPRQLASLTPCRQQSLSESNVGSTLRVALSVEILQVES